MLRKQTGPTLMFTITGGGGGWNFLSLNLSFHFPPLFSLFLPNHLLIFPSFNNVLHVLYGIF